MKIRIIEQTNSAIKEYYDIGDILEVVQEKPTAFLVHLPKIKSNINIPKEVCEVIED